MNIVAESATVERDRYRLLIDAITDYAIYMLDPEGRVSSWNPGAQRFKGYSPDEVIGEHFSRFYTEEDRAAGLPARALSIAATEGRFEQEGWRVRKTGERFWAHVVIDPIRSPSGALLGYAKITRDLTERRATEEALKRSEQQFRVLVEGVTDYAVYMLDVDGHVSSWNTGAQRIKGYRPEEIVGRHFSVFYTPEDAAAGLPADALAIARREGRIEKEGWRVRKDGSRFWAHVIVDAIHDDLGEVIGFAKITRDVTERMEAQHRLDEAREALFQSQKLEAIGQLTGGVAHDFNNLLMAVIGSLELVRKRLPYDPKITPLLDNAMQGAERGATLTQRMLAFARKQELRLEAVDVASLVRGMTDFLESAIGVGVHIELQFPRNLSRVRTDPNQLETALLNLAVNARDAMPKGGVITIRAAAERVERADAALRPGDYVRLSVSDTGEGMDEDTLGRATEPFFTTKGVGKGTGLGLSMVHGLAAQSGGRLQISSRSGEGTTIELWLPVAGGDEIEAPAAEPPPRDGAGQRLRILAVDDDALVLTNTVAMLEDIGHEVVVASSGRQALAALKKSPRIDLVVTDHVMPQMNGLELAAAIRDLVPGVPIIIATGYAELAPGETHDLPRLAKPFSLADLERAISSEISGATPA
jgi:PAS domain S-box-containing protein